MLIGIGYATDMWGRPTCYLGQYWLFAIFFTLCALFPEKRAQVSSGRPQWPAGTRAHQQVATGKQHVQAMGVFRQASIDCFGKTKIAFHYQEGVLHLAAY